MSQLGNDERSYNGSTRLVTESCGTRPASFFGEGPISGEAGEITETPTAQAMENATTLEQRKTKLGAVSTRKPAVANALLRMGLLTEGCRDSPEMFSRRQDVRAHRARGPHIDTGELSSSTPVYSKISPYGRSEEEAAAPSPYPRNTPLR